MLHFNNESNEAITVDFDYSIDHYRPMQYHISTGQHQHGSVFVTAKAKASPTSRSRCRSVPLNLPKSFSFPNMDIYSKMGEGGVLCYI